MVVVMIGLISMIFIIIMHYCDFLNNQRKEYNKNTEGANDIITMVFGNSKYS